MKRKHDDNVLPPAYEGVERQLMAVFYSGVYVTNADIAQVGKKLGLDLPLKDRMALLKQLMRHAHDNGQKTQLMQGFIELLQKRAQEYQQLAQAFPQAAPILGQMMQKARATAMLLQREMRSNTYE
ncbi:hypothetical protein [Hydrogenimonas sp.]